MLSHHLTKSSLRRIAWSLFILPIITVFAFGSRGAQTSVAPEGLAARGAHFTAAEISKRAMKLCLSFSDSASIISPPQFVEQDFATDLVGVHSAGTRNLWTMLCQADDKTYTLSFNDQTGNLVSLRTVDPANYKIAWKLQAPDEPARIALSYFREMGLVSPGTRIQLKETPMHRTVQRAWVTTWTAYNSSAKEPYTIQIVLSDVDGKPIRVLNNQERKI